MGTDVQVLYFGILREMYVQAREEHFSLASGATVADLVERIGERHPPFVPIRERIRIAVNEEFAASGHVLSSGDTVALIPPIAGGSDRYCVVTDEPLRIDPLVDAVAGPGQGAVVAFVGTVRDENEGHEVTELRYEAYSAMALRALNSVIDRCEQSARGARVAVSHRIGELQVGDAAVVLAASAPHRAEAFAAARMCIELLKQEVPIWKRETSPDGAEWLGMRP
ncbi:molybdenum cofactor biosynthesis protein MoaE [Streptomyces pacificus]|uniref:Molybdopterin synthase catalytic subunit 1 n=1 Tax=Streptomyces pacificus TaxID=2705029 RepID=A0A6A0AWP5_9ACTN|nr:molybdenum cofactor biosynthesis protein MoaE [Streptomyces pacificus]GFH36783.1 molybdopterin converting factor subunit 1 [Streptomyces pacificus]